MTMNGAEAFKAGKSIDDNPFDATVEPDKFQKWDEEYGEIYATGRSTRTVGPDDGNEDHPINMLAERAYEAAYRAGWGHDENGVHLSENPYMMSRMIALATAELSEALQGDRKGNPPDEKLPHRSTIEVELADAIIYILGTAAAYDFDIGGAIEDKLAYNATRVDHSKEGRARKGGKRY